jgi:hypothetical protein
MDEVEVEWKYNGAVGVETTMLPHPKASMRRSRNRMQQQRSGSKTINPHINCDHDNRRFRPATKPLTKNPLVVGGLVAFRNSDCRRQGSRVSACAPSQACALSQPLFRFAHRHHSTFGAAQGFLRTTKRRECDCGDGRLPFGWLAASRILSMTAWSVWQGRRLFLQPVGERTAAEAPSSPPPLLLPPPHVPLPPPWSEPPPEERI